MNGIMKNSNKIQINRYLREHNRKNIYYLQQIPALSNIDLNIWAKTFKDNEIIRKAILNEYRIRQIA